MKKFHLQDHTTYNRENHNYNFLHRENLNRRTDIPYFYLKKTSIITVIS
jgi:hypothetical protein